MEIILNYLERMFADLPDTQEVRRIKAEMAEMMEEKYAELLTEGKSENEAIGTVIAEFGSVEELAREFKIDRTCAPAYSEPTWEKQSEGRRLSAEECRQYIETMTQRANGIGTGVLLILLSLIFPVMGEEIFGTEKGGALGTVCMLVLIAVSVVLFIIHGMAMSRFDYMKKEVFVLDRHTAEMLSSQEQAEQSRFVASIAAGVVLCIFSFIPAIINESVLHLNENVPPCILFALVGAGVYLFITAGVRKGCYSVLLQRADYRPEKKKAVDRTERIAGIYWPCVVLIYLVYSFLSHDWGRSWIIWPAAGLLFAVITAICREFFSGKETDY